MTSQKKYFILFLSLLQLFQSATPIRNLVSECSTTPFSDTQGYAKSALCDGVLIQFGTQWQGYSYSKALNGKTWACVQLSKTASVRSFFLAGSQSQRDNAYNYRATNEYKVSVYSNGDRENFVGICKAYLDGQGHYACDTVHIGNLVCLENDLGNDMTIVEFMVYEDFPISQNANALTSSFETTRDLTKLTLFWTYINKGQYNNQVIKVNMNPSVENQPAVLLQLNAQTYISFITAWPAVKSEITEDYNMPTTDTFCNSFLNDYLVTVYDVDGKETSCTTLVGLDNYQESTCNGAEVYQAQIKLDGNNIKQTDSGVDYCEQSRNIFAMSLFIVMSDCSCSSTSMAQKKMPNAPLLTPNIPSSIILNEGDPIVTIPFTLGYDTVSCTCGNADCFTECNSDTDMTAKFTDNLTGLDITDSCKILKWNDGTLEIMYDENSPGDHSISVSLILKSYPTAEPRSYNVFVTIVLPIVYITEYETVVSGYANDTTTKSMRSLLDPQAGEILILEYPMDLSKYKFDLEIEDLTLIVTSYSDSDSGQYDINLVVYYENQPNRPTSQIDVTLILQEKVTTEFTQQVYEPQVSTSQKNETTSQVDDDQKQVKIKTTSKLNSFQSIEMAFQFSQLSNQESIDVGNNTQPVEKVPYLYLSPMNSTGSFEIKSSCKLFQLDDPSQLLQENKLNDQISVSDLAFVMKKADPDDSRAINDLTINLDKMEEKSLLFKFDFANPSLLSTSSEGYDHLEFYLLSNKRLRCEDGRKFVTAFDTNTKSARRLRPKSKFEMAAISLTIPPQLEKNQEGFIQETKKQVGQTKILTLGQKISKILFRSSLNAFFASILALNFMSFQMALSLTYPAVLTSFFGQIMEILNQDILSEFTIFEIDFTPRQYLAEPFSDQLGFLGFSSKAIVINIGTMFWVILGSIIHIIVILFGNLLFKNTTNYTKTRKWFQTNYKSQFYNGILETYDAFELTLMMMAQIQLDGITTHLDLYNFSMSDILMTVIIIGFPCIKIYFVKLIMDNYEDLKNRKSKSTSMFGYLVQDMQLKQTSKSVIAMTCFRDLIKNFTLAFIITRASSKAWLQLISIACLIEFDAIFMCYFVPYGHKSYRQREEQISSIQCMLFHYQIICFSDFVTDPIRKQEMAEFTIYYAYYILLLKFLEFFYDYSITLLRKVKFKIALSRFVKSKEPLLQQRKQFAIQSQVQQLQQIKFRIYKSNTEKLMILSTKIGNSIDIDRNNAKRKNLLFDQNVYEMIFEELEKAINESAFYYVDKTQKDRALGKTYILKLPNPREDLLFEIRKKSKLMHGSRFPKEIQLLIKKFTQTQINTIKAQIKEKLEKKEQQQDMLGSIVRRGLIKKKTFRRKTLHSQRSQMTLIVPTVPVEQDKISFQEPEEIEEESSESSEEPFKEIEDSNRSVQAGSHLNQVESPIEEVAKVSTEFVEQQLIDHHQTGSIQNKWYDPENLIQDDISNKIQE